MRRVLVTVALLGCPHDPVVSDPPSTTATPDDPPAEACGSEALRLDDLAWLPSNTRAAIVIDLHDPALSGALATLAAHARGSEHGLPIDVAFSLSQYGWQVPAVRATLARAGLHPATIVWLRTDAVGSAFVLAHDCDLDELRARTSAAWAISWRTIAEGAIGRAAAASDPPFAWDVLALSGQRLVLVAAGQGAAWLSSRPAPANEQRLAETIAGLQPAPIRGALAGQALVDPSASQIADTQALRVTVDHVEMTGQ